ncbi:MAG: hypothetical protein WB507_00235 [Solirubrobacterales bacterium]
MRKRLTLIIALGAAIAVSVASVAIAGGEKPTVVEAGNLILTLNGGVSPTTLPKNKFAPITLKVSGGIATKDGSQPPALREAIIDTDKNGTVNAKGLPTCTASKITATDTQNAKKACPKAIVGSGKTSVRVAFPESTPFSASGPLVVFNGGEKGGVTTLYIHAYVAVPAPTAIVTTVKIKKEHRGRFGLRSIATIPPIAGGSGSVTNFELKIGKTFTYKGKKQSYLEAKCASGSFAAEADAIFAGGIEAKGQVIRPCKAKG